jgi:hypothetical protein
MNVSIQVICRARARVAGTENTDLVAFSNPDHHEPGVKLHVQVPHHAPFTVGERYTVHFEHDPYVPAVERPGFDHDAHAAARADLEQNQAAG